MLILQHEKNFMDDYIRHFAQSDTGNGKPNTVSPLPITIGKKVQAATKDKETAL